MPGKTSRPRIALVIEIDWPYKHHQGVLSGILEFSRPRGWCCEYAPFLDTSGRREPFDGVIGRATRSMERYVLAHRIPAVNVWVNSPTRMLANVLPDQVAAGTMAAQLFVARGFRRCGFLGRLADANSRLMLEGFQSALKARNIPVSTLIVRDTTANAAEWRAFQSQLRRWLASWTLPIAIVCATDVLARQLIDLSLREGMRIPRDVAILGQGNTEMTCEMSEPRLSSIEHSFERVGTQAAVLLETMMAHPRRPPSTTLIPPAFIVERTSTDAFAVADPDVCAALHFIQEHSHRPVRVEDVLAAVPLSRRTLERRFREVLGRSIHDEITRAYIERAKRLLLSTPHPLKWIASRSGFSSSQRLSQVFRDLEAITPQEFRRLNGKAASAQSE